MNIQIKTTGGLVSTEAISDYVHKRCEHFSKILSADPNARVVVELGKTTSHHKHGDIFVAKVNITAMVAGKQQDFFASSEREDLYAAIDAVRDDIFRELTSGKERQVTLVRRGGAKIKNMLKGFF